MIPSRPTGSRARPEPRFAEDGVRAAVGTFDSFLDAGRSRGYVFDADTVQGPRYHGQPADWSCRLVLNDRRPQFELPEPAFRL